MSDTPLRSGPDRPRLEEVLADAREQASILASHGHKAQAASMRSLCDAVRDAMTDYLLWLSEPEAMTYSARGQDYLRSRFADWQTAECAEWRGRTRYYRACVLPRRHLPDLARAEGRRMARAS